MNLLLILLSSLFITEGFSLLVDSNTPVHLLKSTGNGLIKDTRTGLFDKNKIALFWDKYQTLGPYAINQPIEPYRVCNVGSSRTDKMMSKMARGPSEEKFGFGLWNSLFGGPIRRPLKPYVPTPDIVYPEILVIIDYELYASFKTLNELISRLYAFWEDVDKLYEPLNQPKIKLSISGVLIATDRDVFEFLKSSATLFNWSGGIDYEDANYNMDSWLYRYKDTFSSDNYDVFIVMTSSEDSGLLSTTVGLATVAGACEINNYYQTLNRGGIVFATPNFQDKLTAAHELGHLFGLRHDGELGCGDDYIMSAVNKRYNVIWSSCSQEALRQYFTNYQPTCLYNKPKTVDEK